jgi:CubicO group peptidase (beta-lactamase class C family)
MHYTISRLYLSALAICCCLTLSAQPAWIRDSLDAVVVKTMQAEQVPGLALAVIQDGKVVLQKTYGVREAGKTDRVDANTLFMIGSNTKAYTATALTLLENEGKLNIDDKLVRWMPKFKLLDECRTNQVTLRDLLCHRLGANTFLGDFTFWTSSLTREGVIQKMGALQLPYELRTRYGYCNSAFLAAGQVIPLVTGGTSWEDFIRERFFKPLGMQQALALSAEVPLARNMARSHTLLDGKQLVLPFPLIDNLAPAGSISLNINDMTRWIAMQMDTGRYQGKTIVPARVILKTWEANTIVSPKTGETYGLGWFMSHYAGKRIIMHDGGVDGFLTTSCFLPEQRLGVIVLTNSDNNAIYSTLRNKLLDAYLGVSAPNPMYAGTHAWKKEVTNETERIAGLRNKMSAQIAPTLPFKAYSGTYTHPLYGESEVRYNPDDRSLTLFLTLHPGVNGTLKYMGDHQFMCTFSNPTFGIHPLVFVEEKGKIAKMRLKVNDFIEYGTYEFVR